MNLERFVVRNFRHLCKCVAASALVFSGIVSLHAENLVSIKTGGLASLPAADAVSRLMVIDGRAVALGVEKTWLLDEENVAWQSDAWRPQSQVVGIANGGREAYLLLAAADGTVGRLDKLTLASGKLASTVLPPLPAALESAQGAVLQGTLYVTGEGADGRSQLYALDTTAVPLRWTAHDGWPRSAAGNNMVTSIVGQTAALYVTVSGDADKQDRLLRWTAKEGWTSKGKLTGTVLEGTARATGQAHVLYLIRSPQPTAAPSLMTFHTITGSWAALGDPMATGARSGVGWRNGVLWERPSPTGRSEFAFAEIESGKLLLNWLDWIVIVIYLLSMLGMGLYFYLREKRASTADFFVGGRSIPFWAAGVSLYAANTSSISYIAIPAKAFETNWQYLTNNLVAVLGLMFVAVWIVPLLRRLNLMSVFQFLETRFHPVIRMLASALFIVVQIGSRMSVILFLPSLAIATMTGIDVTWSILIMGVFTMIYTALGGMKAVVWTDVVQLIVKMGGIFFAIGFIVYMLDGGVAELLATANAEDKMKLFDWSFDLTKATVWGFIFLVLFDVVLTFPKDQVLMQRVLSTKSDKDAGKSIWTFAAIMIPGGFMFYMVGTALYAFYKAHPERMNPLLTIDATFPLFIAAELPMGVRGLIVAGILAAAMATLSSIMNSVATLASVDFYEKLVKNPTPKRSVRFAEAMTVVTGLVGMGVALLLSRFDIHSLFDISIELAGLLGGGFAGAYTLGMFTRRANWQGVAIGVGVSITLTTIAWSMKLVHPYFYLAISILLCIVVGYLASWLFPAPTAASLAGLTVYERPPKA